ncbi:alanine racemase C-terminal domain-containing protein [Chelatococcus sp. YT9]|uniref:alanine racemase C-terminal domain-containing protein n=1 Tax=Chelatococcus sp. YT9 TaxID=2835635 RepID=UPI001BCFEF86|nr:alanine racemase C-terminal domain-containing protein [Chelatococcus sp. YT9]MBS7700189.1 hypothetical protein [Chelatococcus sp. YT9]
MASPPTPFMRLKPDMRLGPIPFGWRAGIPGGMPNDAVALIRRCWGPLIAPTHSELIRVGLTDIPEAEVGDEVVLLRRSGGVDVSLAELAEQWGVSTYDEFRNILS